MGATAAKSARLALVWGTSGIQGFSAQPTASPGAAAGFDAVMTAATDRAFQANVTGDANRRLVVYADGKAEWGDGVGSRDTNLYRSAANKLKTDDMLITVIGLGVGNSAAATTSVGTLVRKMEVFDASGASLGFVPIYSSIT
ncbi:MULTISPECIES: hypothetical protein [unclassified Streptomyces]|uniref:hypothetical protein n=1 Tax=unclassified Streptomyces TaxID=2593676 RepID=UPI00336A7703